MSSESQNSQTLNFQNNEIFLTLFGRFIYSGILIVQIT